MSFLREPEKFGFGISFIDNFFGGGLYANKLNIFYGPPGVGKTTFSYHFALSALKRFAHSKIAYFDNDHAFSVTRFMQITNDEDLLSRLIIFRPKTTVDFEYELSKLSKFDFRAVIIDSLASLYRVEFFDKPSKQLVGQMSKSLTVLRDFMEESGKNIGCFITDQVYSKMSKEKSFDPVGGIMLKYLSSVLVELSFMKSNRQMRIIKHPNIRPKKFLYGVDKFGLKPVYVKNETKKRTLFP